jgi:hypothetical protein
MNAASSIGLRTRSLALLMLLGIDYGAAAAQQVATRFACSVDRTDDGGRVVLADSGEIRLNGTRIETFRWESALLHRGSECSIDDSDGLQAELIEHGWRISLHDAQAARERRGYDFVHGLNCTIRVRRSGNLLQLTPSCPALCGSRNNFSELTVDMTTGNCRYEE